MVNCYIPHATKSANLNIYDNTGKLVKTYIINGRNQTSVEVERNVLNAGVYFYTLIIDNQEIDSKRMILSN